jgi:two-component system OmpR family sensor kinase
VPGLSLLQHLPIRLKLTLLFTGVMAVLLAALSAFLYLRFRSDLDYNINQSLRARAVEIASLVRDQHIAREQGSGEALPGRGENFVQIISRQGSVLAASAGYQSPRLLRPSEIAKAARAPLVVQRGVGQRLYAMPVDQGDSIVVAGVSLAERDAAFDKLEDALITGVPLALLLASIAAYGLAAAALTPVESMRRRAASISSSDADVRLPLPASVDEIHRLGSTLNEMLDRLHDGLKRERAFLANASHELRMPLTVLKTELEVTLRERADGDGLRAALSSAAEETDRIVRLAEDLLLMARAEQGQLPIQRREIPLGELLETVASRSMPAVQRAGRTLVVENAGDSMLVSVDLDRIQQAVGNLVDNALRYGGGTITLTARVDATQIELHVTDEGQGFPVDFLPSAFDRFSRADPARSRGGAGLGLSIVQTIAGAHDGVARADNLPAGGADVWLTLPGVRKAG